MEHSQDFIDVQLTLFKLIKDDNDFMVINHKFKKTPDKKYVVNIITEQIYSYVRDKNIINTVTTLIKYSVGGIKANKLMQSIKKMKLLDKTFVLFFYHYYLDHKSYYHLKNQIAPKISFKKIVKEEIVKYIEIPEIKIENENSNNINSNVYTIIKLCEFKEDKEKHDIEVYLNNNDTKLLKYKIESIKLAKQLYYCSSHYNDYINKILFSSKEIDIDRYMKDLRMSF